MNMHLLIPITVITIGSILLYIGEGVLAGCMFACALIETLALYRTTTRARPQIRIVVVAEPDGFLAFSPEHPELFIRAQTRTEAILLLREMVVVACD